MQSAFDKKNIFDKKIEILSFFKTITNRFISSTIRKHIFGIRKRLRMPIPVYKLPTNKF